MPASGTHANSVLRPCLAAWRGDVPSDVMGSALCPVAIRDPAKKFLVQEGILQNFNLFTLLQS